jgi:tetratricopeptide (TPR) repeat protein
MKKMRQSSVIKKILIFLFALTVILANSEQKKEMALHHFMQGEFLMNQGNYALAVLEFQDAIDFDPNASTIHVSIADAYRRLGKSNRSEDHLRIALDLDPEDSDALEMIGQLYLSQKKFGDAEIVYKDLVKLVPDNIEYLFTLADLAQIQKNWDLAIDYYIEGYRVNSSAINALEQALQIALTTNSFDRAEEVCILLLEEDPESLKFLETIRDLSLFNQKYQVALEFVNRIEKIQGSTSEILIQKSALYEELKNPEKALNIMFEAFEKDSLNINVLHRLVTLLLDDEDNEKAILYNQRIIDVFPDDPRGFINHAVMALSGKKPEEAILALRPHVGRFSKDFTVQYLLGTAYYQSKDYDNAEIHLGFALTIFPESRNTKHNLALIYDSTNKWGKSDVLYMELIASDSTDAQAYNNYAYSLVERGEDMEFALELSKNSIRLSPKSAPYLDTLGWIYFKMDRIDEAIKVIKESLSIDNGNPTIQAHLEEIIKAKSNPEISKVIQAEIKD